MKKKKSDKKTEGSPKLLVSICGGKSPTRKVLKLLTNDVLRYNRARVKVSKRITKMQ